MKYHFTLDSKWNDESLKFSRKAVALNDQDPYALISLAGSLVEKGEFEEARIHYEKSLSLDSTNITIYTELGYLYEQEEKYDKAEEYLKKAIVLDPDSHLTHYYLGGCHHRIQ